MNRNKHDDYWFNEDSFDDAGRNEPVFELFGRYKLLEQLGVGCSGVSWIAEDLHLGIYVVVKIATTDRDCFFRDAKLATQISELVIGARDAGIESGRYYFARDLVETSLDMWLELGTPVGAARSLDILGQLIAALVDLHDRGYAHGRLHPGNVLLESDEDGRECAYLVDCAAVGGVLPLRQRSRFVAPELLSRPGHLPTPLSDQWSLAALAQTMLADPTVEGLSAAVAAVIRRALSPTPTDRFPSCLAFKDALVAAMSVHASPPSPVPTEPEWWQRIDPHSWAWRTAQRMLEEFIRCPPSSSAHSPFSMIIAAQRILDSGPGAVPGLAAALKASPLGSVEGIWAALIEEVERVLDESVTPPGARFDR